MTDPLRLALELAEQAGSRILQMQDGEAVGRKSAERDLVTQADLASEQILLDGLRSAFPADAYCAEESAVGPPPSGRVWYLDPLDGTTNFVHRLPLWCVSIALYQDRTPLLGVVAAPALGETYFAAAEEGAWCRRNGTDRRMGVSATDRLDDALLATGFPYRRHLLAENNLENFQRFYLKQRGIRRMGAAALDLALLADGRLDGFWELHLQPWDVAAGALLIQEAGGRIDAFQPDGDWLHGGNILAANPSLLEPMRRVLLAGRGRDYPPLGDRTS